MKKLNKIIISSIVLIMILTGFMQKTHADTGYDKTYSGSSTSSSSYSSSSSSSTRASETENNNLISNQTSTSKEIEKIKENSEEDKKNLENKISELSEKIDNNSKTNLYLIIAMAVIGTISIITFILAIIILIKRKK